MNKHLNKQELKKTHLKRILLWTGSIAIVAISVWGISALYKASQPSLSDGQVSATDKIFGNPQGIVELVEYSDFQCPACAGANPKVNQLLIDYKDQIKFVYRHFPLKQIHPNAEISAKAAEAAGLQGKFMEMGDLLFRNQDSWKNSSNPRNMFVNFARQLELDIEKFQKDIESATVETKIDRDLNSGIEAGVSSTPTFFLNGKKISNPATYQAFQQLIQEAINEKQ